MKLENVARKIEEGKAIICKKVSCFLFIVMFVFVSSAQASVEPVAFETTLAENESTVDPITVNLPGKIPSADIVFSLDLTGSMGLEISTVKQEILRIMASLDAVIEDARYAVVSYMDYPDSYCSYGYCARYGHSLYGDYAYNLDTPLTYDRALVKSKIDALRLGWGADGPEDYARVFNEAANDPEIGFRDTARKIMINFGDALPHDDNIYEGISTYYSYSYGGDPGRDGIMFTDDDVDLQTALNEMRDNNIVLFHVNSGWNQTFWKYWTGITGGDSILLSDASLIPQVILTLVEGLADELNNVDNLFLQVPDEFQSFVESVTPDEYFNLVTPDSVPFDIGLTVPAGTEPGIYEFVVTAMGNGLSYGDHHITINVPETVSEEDPIPSSTFGKVTGGGFFSDDIDSLKYSFGFNVHFDNKGHVKMKGQLQFVDRDGNENFHGNEVLSLAVDENRAVFTGTGRLNGEEGFSYRVDVVDNGNPGRGNDTFFIKITDSATGTVEYAVSGTLAGGNIKVHEVKAKVKKAKPAKARGKKK